MVAAGAATTIMIPPHFPISPLAYLLFHPSRVTQLHYNLDKE